MEDNIEITEIQYIKTLDGWRAIAILAVVISHLTLLPEYRNSQIKIPDFGLGVRGVSLFFAISGFIISLKLFKELDLNGTIDFKKFYKRRFYRLFPTSFLYLLILIIFSLFGFLSVSGIEVVSSIIPFRNYLPSTGELFYTSLFWSLSIEEHFYLMLPSFLVNLKKNKRYILGLFLTVILVAIWRKLGTVEGFVSIVPLSKFTNWNTFGRLDGLIYGSILAFFYKNHNKSLHTILGRFNTLFIILTIFSVFYFKLPLTPVWEAILWPILIYSTIANNNTFMSKILESKPLKFIGLISYSLYIWHPFFMHEMPDAPFVIKLFVGHWYSVLISFGVAYLNYRFIETPFRKSHS